MRVTALSGYRLHVEFDDGAAGEIEMADRLFGAAFKPLHDPNEFSKVFVDEFGAIAWPWARTWLLMGFTGDSPRRYCPDGRYNFLSRIVGGPRPGRGFRGPRARSGPGTGRRGPHLAVRGPHPRPLSQRERENLPLPKGEGRSRRG